MTSRLNLSEMSEDLHNNPPFEILQTELGPENNADVKTYKTGGECLYFYLYNRVSLFRVKFDKSVVTCTNQFFSFRVVFS